MLKVLIFSRESGWFGGVVNFIDLLNKAFSNEVKSVRFLVGRRKGMVGLLLRPITLFSDAFRLFFYVLFNHYDGYHLNPSLNGPSLIRDGLFILVLKFLKRKKLIVCFHGWELSTEKIIEKSRWRKWLFIKTFCNVDCVLVLAKPFKHWLIEQGCDENKIRLFTTMFDGSYLQNEKKNELTDSAEINILFLSRFVREKGVYELLEAFKSILVSHDNVKLIFAGTGPEEDAMKCWVVEHGISGNVEFKGYLRDAEKASVLNNAQIFVLPSYTEGLPVSVLEAMAAGLAVITTPVGGIPDVVVHDRNGVLLDYQVTAENIKNAIESLLNSPRRIQEMGEVNRIEAWEKYDAPVVTRFFENIYKNGC